MKITQRPLLGLVLLSPLLFSNFVVAEDAAELVDTDGEIAKAMGPPYYSGAILPTPREVEYYDEAVDLANGHEGVISDKLEIRHSGKARDIMIRL